MQRKTAIRIACVLAVLWCALPAFCQDTEDAALREANIAGTFALGNLFVKDIESAQDPVQQLKAFFDQARMPLSRDQQKKLESIVVEQQKALKATSEQVQVEGGAGDTVRRLNQEYMKQANAVLSVNQQAEWRHYRIEQIRLRGGLASLSAMLEEARLPLSDEQQKSLETIYRNFESRRSEALSESNTEKMDNLVLGEFHRVSALLTPEQRQAVMATRPLQSASRRRP